MGMSTTDLFNKLNDPTATTTERGKMFEKLVAHYLQTDPAQRQRFKEIVPWGKWEHRTGRDIGIDPYDYYHPIAATTGAGFEGIKFNDNITIPCVPAEVHDYRLGPRSPLGWVLDRYQVTKHGASKIVNDPNDWARHVGDPRYILDLIGRLTTVSLETNRIVAALPPRNVAPQNL